MNLNDTLKTALAVAVILAVVRYSASYLPGPLGKIAAKA